MKIESPSDIGQHLRNAARTPKAHESRILHLDTLIGMLVMRCLLQKAQLEGVVYPEGDAVKEASDDIRELLDAIAAANTEEFLLLFGEGKAH